MGLSLAFKNSLWGQPIRSLVKHMVQPARVAGDESLAIVVGRMSHAETANAFVYEQERIVGVVTLSDQVEMLLGVRIR